MLNIVQTRYLVKELNFTLTRKLSAFIAVTTVVYNVGYFKPILFILFALLLEHAALL